MKLLRGWKEVICLQSPCTSKWNRLPHCEQQLEFGLVGLKRFHQLQATMDTFTLKYPCWASWKDSWGCGWWNNLKEMCTVTVQAYFVWEQMWETVCAWLCLTFNAHSCYAECMLCGCRCCFENGLEIQLKAECLYSPWSKCDCLSCCFGCFSWEMCLYSAAWESTCC